MFFLLQGASAGKHLPPKLNVNQYLIQADAGFFSIQFSGAYSTSSLFLRPYYISIHIPNHMYYVAVFFLGHRRALEVCVLQVIYEHSQSYLQF